MAKEIKIKSVAQYNGHGIKTNKSVDLGLRFEYSEMPNYIKLIQFLNENVVIKVKRNDCDPQTIGTFMIKEIKVDHDGEGIVKFNSMLDSVEADEINTLVGEDRFRVAFEASVDVEDEENGEE